MSSAFGRVLLLDVLLGLRIQPVLAADCGKHLCILPCTRSACETICNKDRCIERLTIAAASLRRPVTLSSSSDSVSASDPLSSPPLRFPAGSLAWKPSKSDSDLESGTIPQLNATLQALPSRPHQILPFIRIHYSTGRRRLVPGTACLVLGLVAVSSPPDSVATFAASLVVPTIF